MIILNSTLLKTENINILGYFVYKLRLVKNLYNTNLKNDMETFSDTGKKKPETTM